MEVFGAAAAFVTVVSVISNCLRLARALNEVSDPKLKSLRATVTAQSRRTENWYRAMRISGDRSSEIDRKILPEDIEEVRLILSDITEYFKLARKRFNKLDRMQGKASRKNLAAKFRWIYGDTKSYQCS